MKARTTETFGQSIDKLLENQDINSQTMHERIEFINRNIEVINSDLYRKYFDKLNELLLFPFHKVQLYKRFGMGLGVSAEFENIIELYDLIASYIEPRKPVGHYTADERKALSQMEKENDAAVLRRLVAFSTDNLASMVIGFIGIKTRGTMVISSKSIAIRRLKHLYQIVSELDAFAVWEDLYFHDRSKITDLIEELIRCDKDNVIIQYIIDNPSKDYFMTAYATHTMWIIADVYAENAASFAKHIPFVLKKFVAGNDVFDHLINRLVMRIAGMSKEFKARFRTEITRLVTNILAFGDNVLINGLDMLKEFIPNDAFDLISKREGGLRTVHKILLDRTFGVRAYTLDRSSPWTGEQIDEASEMLAPSVILT